MSGVGLALSTRVKPPKKFTVDKVEYDMLGMDHLSKDDETEVMALFARHSSISQELDMAPNVAKGKQAAERLRKCRYAIIAKLTTLPTDVAEKLPLFAQAQLLEEIETQMGSEDEDSGLEEEPAEEQPVTASASSSGADF
jgi:hypothetical protein